MWLNPKDINFCAFAFHKPFYAIILNINKSVLDGFVYFTRDYFKHKFNRDLNVKNIMLKKNENVF